MEKRKRDDFGTNDRGGRFDKKPGKPEYRSGSKSWTGPRSKSRDDSGEFSDKTRGSRGPAERTGVVSGKWGAGPEGGGKTYGKRGAASEGGGKTYYGKRDATSEGGGKSYYGKRGASPESGGKSYGKRDAVPGSGEKTYYGKRDAALEGGGKTYYGKRGAAPEGGGKSYYGKRGAAPEGGEKTYGKRGAVPENGGKSYYGKRDAALGSGEKTYGKRDAVPEDRGTAHGYRSASSDSKGFSSDRNEFSPDRKGFSPKRGASSMHNHNAKKSASEDKFSSTGKQEADIQEFQEDLDKLEGRNSVLEALKSGRSINRIFVSKGEREGSVNQIIAMARQNHILIQEIDRAKLDEMSVTHAHQGVIALTAAKDYVEMDEILAKAKESGRPPFIIILDEITDPYNLGSILRTANAAGVHGIIIPKRRAVGLTSSVSKASAGAIEYVPVARVTNIVQAIESLKKQNIWIVGTDSTGEKAYFESDMTGPVALVIGSEGEGMGKLVRESCDFVVNIPMLGKISSLNAAVAGAIVTYEIFRQRNTKKS